MSTDEKERNNDKTLAKLCRETGWVCRLCGAIPERGKSFEDDLCDDCKLKTESE